MTQPAITAMSVEEYFRSEPESPVRREYVNGFAYTLEESGVTEAHSLISINFLMALRPLAKAKSHRVYLANLLVGLPESNTYYYPDVMVTCEPFKADTRVKYAPSLLIEVLSSSTAHNDHFAKYHAYTALPSLELYLLVEQHTRLVYAYERVDGRWLKREYRDSDTIPLPFLDGEIGLDAIYEDVRPA